MFNFKTFDDFLANDEFYDNTLKLKFILEEAVKTRVNFQPNICKNCFNGIENCTHSTVGILFSGGLDCTVLALMSDKYVPKNQSIDLLNVSFGKSLNDNFMTPDRITGYESWKELKRLCPKRQWNFLEINITKDELQTHLSDKISNLIYPLKTILDESLGCALWFASRAIDKNCYQSPCRIILSGIGADELLGGYSSHRKAFKNGDWNKLIDELKRTWVNISERNLGRDDRVVCDHGRQLRTPYLDENVSDFLNSLPASLRCYPKKDNIGFGDKLLLRLLAFHLKLQNVCHLPKRALQFGSRVANKREKGHEYSHRLNN